MGDCMTLYEHGNFDGKRATRCSSQQQSGCSGDSLGRCSIMPCADDGGSKCWGFGDETSSVKVDDGMVLNLYKDKNYGGDKLTYTGGNYGTIQAGWNDSVSSWELKKDCSKNKWLWDNDCETRKSNTINNTNQEYNRQSVCSNASLGSDSNCKNWCFKGQNQQYCSSSIGAFCNDPNNTTSVECRAWGEIPTNKVAYDVMATNYCNSHLSDNDFCSCFENNARNKLSVEEQTLLYGGVQSNSTNNRAICWSKNCGVHGYQTNSMYSATNACPKCYQVSSNNKTTIENINKSVIDAKSVQTCTVNDNSTSIVANTTPPPTTTTPPPPTTTTPPPTTTTPPLTTTPPSINDIKLSSISNYAKDTWTKHPEYIIIVICIVFLFFGFIIAITKKGSGSDSTLRRYPNFRYNGYG